MHDEPNWLILIFMLSREKIGMFNIVSGTNNTNNIVSQTNNNLIKQFLKQTIAKIHAYDFSWATVYKTFINCKIFFSTQAKNALEKVHTRNIDRSLNPRVRACHWQNFKFRTLTVIKKTLGL